MKNDTIILLVMKHRYLSMVQIIIHNAFLHVNRRTETNFECISDWNFSTTSANNIGGRKSNLPNISMKRNRMGPFLPWYKHSLYSLTQLNATKNVPEKNEISIKPRVRFSLGCIEVFQSILHIFTKIVRYG